MVIKDSDGETNEGSIIENFSKDEKYDNVHENNVEMSSRVEKETPCNKIMKIL